MRRWAGWIGAGVLAASLAPGVCRAQGAVAGEAANAATIERRINEFQEFFDEANRLSGVLLIAHGDEIVLHKAFGLADVSLRVPNTTETRFCVASITKPFTTIVLTRLIAERVVSPADPISTWLPEFPRGEEITIADLARHRAGIPHRVTTSAQESQPLSALQVAGLAAAATPRTAPGGASSYSSAGYSVLACCLELASGRPFGALLSEHVFQPASMLDSIDKCPGRLVPGAANAYVPGRGELWGAPLKDLSFLVGAGSTYSTAEDLWRFTRALSEGRLGVPSTVFDTGGRLALTGATNGWFASIDTYPEENLTCIWVGNTWGGCAGQLRDAMLSIWRGDQVAPQPRPPLVSTPPESALESYAGWYESRPGASSQVRVLDGELWYADSMLLPIGPDRFWHQPWHCEVAFIRGDDGGVIAIERRPDGTTTTLRRLPDDPQPPPAP